MSLLERCARGFVPGHITFALGGFSRRGRFSPAIITLSNQGLAVFEFVCERIIPGCTFTERGDSEEKLLEQAMDHLRERHNMDYIDKPLEGRLSSIGILPLK